MSKYFSYLPKTKYGDYTITNIARRVKVKDILKNSPYVFMPYTVENDDRPEDVAFYYYGNVSYTWLIYLANEMIDPYSNWPLKYIDFENMIMKKYANQANTIGYDVINWTQNTNINDNILYYINADGQEINTDTYNLNTSNNVIDTTFIPNEWSPVRIYDHEFELNESKRNIQLINKDYASTVIKEFKGLMNNDG